MKKNIFLCVCALFLITGCFKNSTKDIRVNINKTKGLSYDYAVTNDGIALAITNDTKSNIDFISVDMAVYDTNNNLISVEKQSIHNLDSKQTNVIKISYSDTSYSNKQIKPSKVEIATTPVNYENKVEVSYADKVEGTVSKTEIESELALLIKNNSGVVLNNLNAAVVFYKKSKIVDVYLVSATEVENEYTDMVYLPVAQSNDKTTKYIDYDDVKVIINNAATYNNM